MLMGLKMRRLNACTEGFNTCVEGPCLLLVLRGLNACI